MKNFKFILIIIAFFTCLSLYKIHDNGGLKYSVEVRNKIYKTDPPSLRMYYYIKKYAKEYDIPLDYAFGLAYQETGYRGPFHYSYKHKQISSVGAEGPMQIMIPTANWLAERNVSRKELREDIELNVRLSLKYLRYLHNKYDDWKQVFGAYNSGKPIVNQYALNIYNKNYIWE